MRTFKCWGIPYGLTTKQNETEEVTIEIKCTSKAEFKRQCEERGHKLTNEPYLAK